MKSRSSFLHESHLVQHWEILIQKLLQNQIQIVWKPTNQVPYVKEVSQV